MRDDTTRPTTAQIDRLTGPWQRSMAVTLNTFERLTDFQLQSVQKYSSMAMRQWRSVLEVHDDQTLREFMERQQQAAQEWSREFAEDARALSEIGQEFTEQSQRVAERNVRNLADATRAVVEQARKRTEQVAEQGREGARRASGG